MDRIANISGQIKLGSGKSTPENTEWSLDHFGRFLFNFYYEEIGQHGNGEQNAGYFELCMYNCTYSIRLP